MSALATWPCRSWRLAVAVALCLIAPILRAGVGAESGLEDDRAEAAANDSEALVRLADRYETADGVPFDLRATSIFLEFVAERGHAGAQ